MIEKSAENFFVAVKKQKQRNRRRGRNKRDRQNKRSFDDLFFVIIKYEN